MKHRTLDLNLTVSQEAIASQSGDMFADLTDCIHKLQQLSFIEQNDINQSNLSKIVNKYTGMSVAFTFVEKSYAAYCHLVEVDKNHPFFHQRNKMICHVTNNFKTQKLSEVGYVDLKNSTVSGVFSQYPIKIGIGEFFFKDETGQHSAFSAEEVTAILIHEIGHAFTTFEYLSKTVMTSLVVSTSVKNSMGINEPDKRAKVIVKAASDAGVSLDREYVKETVSKHGESADVVFLTKHVKDLNKLTKTNYYDARNCEQIADQFAVKHGAGAALGSALERLFKMGLHTHYQSTFTFVTIEVLKVATFMLTAVFAVAIGSYIALSLMIASLFMSSFEVKIYDDPKDRLEFIKRQMIEDLKKVKLEDKKQKELIKSITGAIEELNRRIDECTDRDTFMQSVWQVITPWGRSREQQEVKQKQLESALNNDIYVNAAKFSQM